MTRVDICICTYRRASVTDTLASISALTVPDGVAVSVIVVDNDETPSAWPLIETFSESNALPIRYIHCPANNISIARNGGLNASDADLFAFVDDDETVSPEWLSALLEMREATGAAIVLGPVEPLYGHGSPDWMSTLAPHRTRPVWKGGEIRTGYTCNVLIDRAHSALSDLRFEERLGTTGGEDTVYFAAAHRQGASIAYAPDAVVREPVPEARAQLRWLARRRYRMGQTHADLMRTQGGVPAPKLFFSALGKLSFCLLRAGASIASPRNRNGALLRGALHAGVIAGVLGGRTLALYSDTKTTFTGRTAR